MKNRIRFQINLRVLLLFMALCCAVAAHARISLDIRHKHIRQELKLLEIQRSQAQSWANLAAIDARIKALRQRLGQID